MLERMSDQSLPKISVVIRTVGHEMFPRALGSALAQTWANKEVVVVVADPAFDAVAANEAGAVVVATGERLDRPRAANVGLGAAKGQWLLFLDDDDWIDPDHVASLWQAASASANVLLAYSDMLIHKDGGDFVRSVGYWKQTFSDRPFFSMHPPLFSRKLLDLGCRFDEQFTLLEDWDFFLQCAEHTDFLHVHRPTAHYNPHSGSSGGGIGINRDEEKIKPYVALLTAKWGKRYAEITAFAQDALSRADAALAKSDLDSARKALNDGLVVDPGNPLLLNRLAVCDIQSGDVAGTVRALRRACDSDRNAFRMHLQLAMLEKRLGFADRAREIAGHLSTIAKSDEEKQQVAQLTTHLGPLAS
jgi:glycosyltransferase involved in cell wall biosynthesis